MKLGFSEWLARAMGSKPALDEMSTEELRPRLLEAGQAATVSFRAREALEVKPLVGLTDAELRARATALETARLVEKRDQQNVAAIRSALEAARARESEVAAEQEAAALSDGSLRALYEEVRVVAQQAHAGKLRLANALRRVIAPNIRPRLSIDPTLGFRPALTALLGDLLPHEVKQIFDAGAALVVGDPGPREGDRRRSYAPDRPPMPETFRNGEWTSRNRRRDDTQPTLNVPETP